MKNMTTLFLINKQFQKYGDKIFAYFPNDQINISYKDLYQEALNYSHFFLKIGINKGTRVSIIFKTGKNLILSLIGLLNIGAIVYPVDWKMLEKDAYKNIKEFQSNIIIYSEEFENYFLMLKKLFGKEEVNYICLEENEIDTNNYKLINNISNETPALCIFTSGTTGDPKGVLLSHQNIIIGASNLEKSHNLDERDRALACTPLTGINGIIFTLWAPILTGGSVVYYQGMFSSYNAFKLIDKYRVTWFNGIPTHYTIMVKIPVEKNNFSLDSIKFMRSASAPLPPNIQKKFETLYGLPIIETMGLTEMSGQVCSNPMELEKRKIGSVGLPVNTEVRVIDIDGYELKNNNSGELLFKGDGLMIGYYNDQERTKQAVKNGWLYSGDIGYIDDDYFVFIKGRKKDIVIVGGKNVSMREVENILLSNKSVQEVATFGIQDEILGEKIVAYIKLNRNEKITKDEILDFCQNNLSDYKCPKIIKFCLDFPRGGQGKILKSKLKMIYEEELKNE